MTNHKHRRPDRVSFQEPRAKTGSAVGIALTGLAAVGILLFPAPAAQAAPDFGPSPVKHAAAIATRAEQASPSEAEGPAGTVDPEERPLFDPSDPIGGPGGQVPDMSKMLIRLVLAMGIILALLAAGLMAFQRLARRGLKLGRNDRPLRIVDKLSLGPKKMVCLLNTCGRYVVLGVAEREITVLLELTLPDDAEGEQDFAAALHGIEASLDGDAKRRTLVNKPD